MCWWFIGFGVLAYAILLFFGISLCVAGDHTPKPDSDRDYGKE